MSTCKEPITDEILNQLIQICLDKNNIMDAIDVYFSTDTLRKNNSVQKYLYNNMSEKLRKYLYVRQCDKISQTREQKLTETDILTIMRSVLKYTGYKMIGMTDSKSFYKIRVYTIKHDIKKVEKHT